MITFEGRNQVLKSADIINRRAHSLYPHVSCSQIATRVDCSPNMPRYYIKAVKSLSKMRTMLRESHHYFSSLLYGLQEYKVGNCTEEVKLAELIGKINGQKNIYVGAITLDKGEGAKPKSLEHAIAFITDMKIINNQQYNFENNEALIIDPWLGIIDFAGEYFNKLKTVFRKKFKELPNNDLSMELIKEEAKDLPDFKNIRKKDCPRWKIGVIPHSYGYLTEDSLQEFRFLFPELVINDYKLIKLPNLSKILEKKEKYNEKLNKASDKNS